MSNHTSGGGHPRRTHHAGEAHIKVKRVYDGVSASDGRRVLVDRIWPRGVRKEALQLDDWRKDLAPSPGLRAWFAHDPARWEEFRRRYFAELDARADDLADLRALVRRGPVTLLYAARDTEHNNAVALRDYLSRP
jgi:uncharacterized protein YeaO (DUF488 family)